MKNDAKLETIPENHADAAHAFASQAADHATRVWGPAGLEITSTFRPADVVRIVVEELAPSVFRRLEIVELERNIAEIKLADALLRIVELERR